MERVYNEKRRDYSTLRFYSAIALDIGSAGMIIGGAVINNIDLIAIGSSIGFPSIFYSIDVAMEQAKIKKDKKKNLEGLAENQSSNNI